MPVETVGVNWKFAPLEFVYTVVGAVRIATGKPVPTFVEYISTVIGTGRFV
jgi:hypothetical protein